MDNFFFGEILKKVKSYEGSQMLFPKLISLIFLMGK